MRGLFWNSRGLADLAKRRFLADTSVEQQLDFIALLKPVEIILPHNSSELCLVELILTGTVYSLEEDPVGYY